MLKRGDILRDFSAKMHARVPHGFSLHRVVTESRRLSRQAEPPGT
jgi:hypothetical protein